LCISPQNIFICDIKEPNQITDITTELEEPNAEEENNRLFEEFLDLEFNTENETQEELNIMNNDEILRSNQLAENLQELYEDLTRLLKLTESYPNSFLASNWQNELENITK
jgi:hypothetical protein